MDYLAAAVSSSFTISSIVDFPIYLCIIPVAILFFYSDLIERIQNKSTEDFQDENEAEGLLFEDFNEVPLEALPEITRIQLQHLFQTKRMIESRVDAEHDNAIEGLPYEEQDSTSFSSTVDIAHPVYMPEISPSPPVAKAMRMPPPPLEAAVEAAKMPQPISRPPLTEHAPRIKPKRNHVLSQGTLRQYPGPPPYHSHRYQHPAPILSQSHMKNVPVNQPYQPQIPFPPVRKPRTSILPGLLASMDRDLSVFFQQFVSPPQVPQPVDNTQQFNQPQSPGSQQCHSTFQPSTQGPAMHDAFPSNEQAEPVQDSNVELPEDDHDMENQIMEDVEPPPKVDMDVDADVGAAQMDQPVSNVQPTQEEQQQQQQLPQPPADVNIHDERATMQAQAQGKLQESVSNFARNCCMWVLQQFVTQVASVERALENQYQQGVPVSDPLNDSLNFWNGTTESVRHQQPANPTTTTSNSNSNSNSEDIQPQPSGSTTPTTSTPEGEEDNTSQASFFAAMAVNTEVPRGRGGDAFQYTAAQSRGATGTRYPYASMAKTGTEDSLRNASLKASSFNDTACPLPTMPLSSPSTSPTLPSSSPSPSKFGPDGRRIVEAVNKGSEANVRSRLHEEHKLDGRLAHRQVKRAVREAKAKAKAKAEAKAKAQRDAEETSAARASSSSKPEEGQVEATTTPVEVLPPTATTTTTSSSPTSRSQKRQRDEDTEEANNITSSDPLTNPNSEFPPVKKRFRFKGPPEPGSLCEYQEHPGYRESHPDSSTSTPVDVQKSTPTLAAVTSAPPPRKLRSCLKPPRTTEPSPETLGKRRREEDGDGEDEVSPLAHWYTSRYGSPDTTDVQGPSKRLRQTGPSSSSSSLSSSSPTAEANRMRVAARKEKVKKEVKKSLFSSVVGSLFGSRRVTRTSSGTILTRSWVDTTTWSMPAPTTSTRRRRRRRTSTPGHDVIVIYD